MPIGEGFTRIAEAPSGWPLRRGLLSYRHYYYSAGWQVLEERTAPAPNVAPAARQFVWGLRYIDDLILRDRSVSGSLNERLYALQDANWNVTAITDTTGTVQERYAYSAYGIAQFLDAIFNSASSPESFDALYCGYRFDCTSGLYDVRFRDLHVAIGSWLSEDPRGYISGEPPFAYARSKSRLNRTDWAGLKPECSCQETPGPEGRQSTASGEEVASKISGPE